MLIIPETIKAGIKEHAATLPNQEVCGYCFFDDGTVHSMLNIDPDPVNNFRIDPDTHINITETFTNPIIYHTHHGEGVPARLSDRDVIASKALKIPYLLYHSTFNQWDYFDPSDINPYPLINNNYTPDKVEFYLNYPWAFERSDCYALFRNYYRGRLGINLRDFPRGHSPSAVLDPGWNLFLDNYESEGFRLLDRDEELREHDVILMCLVGDNVHHCAIVVDAAKRHAIHVTCVDGDDGQLIPKMSEKFVYGWHGYWYERTRAVIRHRSLEA